MKFLRLKSKAGLVTGAAPGIGAAIARRFGEAARLAGRSMSSTGLSERRLSSRDAPVLRQFHL
jgi:NAD(P)-dependent dehydrogenase (short-subunit alcohol dehydrogenase family)